MKKIEVNQKNIGRIQKKFDAAIILSVTPPTRRLIHNRIAVAMSLYKSGLSGKIIFTGRSWGGLKKIPRTVEADIMARYAHSLGLPEKAILRERLSLETTGSLYFTKKLLLEPHRWHDIVIVTHKSHLAKEKFLARKILGPKYDISYKISESDFNPAGHSSLVSIKHNFAHIQNGNDRAIRSMIQRHAYYKRRHYAELLEKE